MSGVNPIPPTFPRSVAWWAGYFEVSPRTIGEWIDRYAIPFFQPGKERYITPADMMGSLPYFRPGKEPPQDEA